MKLTRKNFPTIALLVSVPLLLAIIFGGDAGDGTTRLPLLMLLLICELGAVINAIAVVLGVMSLSDKPRPRGVVLRLAANALLAVDFALNLFGFWPG
jgi:hypothetical protein